ncbi:MAG: response regulator, partial [Thermodesulfobacteriota bacterium]
MSDLSNCTVLVVDDAEANVDLLVDILGEEYEVAVATDGPSALEFATAELPDLILLDIMMPGMDGYEVCRHLKAKKATRDIPVVFVTALGDSQSEVYGLELGGVDYVHKPLTPAIVKARVRNHLRLKQAQSALAAHNQRLEEEVRRRTEEIAHTQEVTIQSLATLAEYRDPETGGHLQRTKNYVRILARRLANQAHFQTTLTPEYTTLLYKSAPLHDIGKVGIPDDILLKNDKLTPEEFKIIKLHPAYGYEALRQASQQLGSNSFLQIAKDIVYTHHEKWDGSGYPQGLCGQSIPIAGRLMAVADVYDALISKRVYKAPIPHPKAVDIIAAESGAHFDPEVVTAFLD